MFGLNDELPRVEPDDDDFDTTSGALYWDAYAPRLEPGAFERSIRPAPSPPPKESTAEKSGRTIANNITRCDGFGTAITEATLRLLIRTHLEQGGKLQDLVDGTNKVFEQKRAPYYMALGQRNSLVLYTADGARRLDIRR